MIEDCKKIKTAFENRIDKIALFGSITKVGFDSANDIDIAIFMKNPSICFVKSKIEALELNYKFPSINISYKYGGKNKFHSKVYDLILLDSESPDPIFLSRNSKDFIYMN